MLHFILAILAMQPMWSSHAAQYVNSTSINLDLFCQSMGHGIRGLYKHAINTLVCYVGKPDKMM